MVCLPREIPLHLLPSAGDTQQVVIGELTSSEEKALDTIIHTGLGTGIAKPTVTPKRTPSSASAGSPADLPKVEKELRPKTKKLDLSSPKHVNLMEECKGAIIKVNCVHVKDTDTLQVSEEILKAKSVSCYGTIPYGRSRMCTAIGSPLKTDIT